MALRIDFSKLEAVAERLTQAGEVAEHIAGSKGAQAAIKSGLDIVAKDAQARVHSVTGNLKSGIKSYVRVEADRETKMEAGVSYARTRAHHAHLVEEGHGGPHPAPEHPFWEPAVEATMEEAAEAVEKAVEDLAASLFSDG